MIRRRFRRCRQPGAIGAIAAFSLLAALPASGQITLPPYRGVLAGSAGKPYVTAVMSEPSLLRYWRMGEASGDLHDKKGNTTASATSLSYSQTGALAGDTDTAISLDGGASKATLGAGELDWENTQPWTIEFWVKPNINRLTGETEHTILAKMNGGSPFNGFTVELDWNGGGSGTNETVLALYLIDDFWAANGRLKVTGTSVDFQNDVWYHAVVTYDGSLTAAGVHMYVDGVEESYWYPYDTTLVGSLRNTSQAAIGSRGAGQFAAVTLDELAVYTSVLPQTTIANHYMLGLPDALYTTPSGVPVILDTDLADDVDDVMDLYLLHQMANDGKVNLLAVVSTTTLDYGPAAVQVFANYFGRSSLPIGAWHGSGTFGTINDHYGAALAAHFITTPVARSGYPDGVTVYRQALAASAGGVMLIATGYAANLAALLASPGDGISALNGHDLVAAKVKALVIVAGVYPTSSGSAEWNMAHDAADWATVATSWPTPIYAVGIEQGATVDAGGNVNPDVPSTNPLRYTWDLYYGDVPGSTRPAWGTVGVLAACWGMKDWWLFGGRDGTITVDGGGNDSWAATPQASQHYLVKLRPDADYVTRVNAYLGR